MNNNREFHDFRLPPAQLPPPQFYAREPGEVPLYVKRNETNWDNPFYQFAIVLLQKFIAYNLIGQRTEVEDSDVQKLAHDITVRIFFQEKNVDNFLLELTKYILAFRHAQEAGFTSFLTALRDKEFYNQREGETSRLISIAIQQNFSKRFSQDRVDKALLYILTLFDTKSINPNDYTKDRDSFPPFTDRTPEGELGFVSNRAEQEKKNKLFLEQQAANKRQKTEDEEKQAATQKEQQEQARKNQETLARMMGQMKPQKKQRLNFSSGKPSVISQMQRTMEQQNKAEYKQLYSNTSKRDTED